MATAKKNVVNKDPIKMESISVNIWNKIKDLDLELFALEDQFVSKHADPVFALSTGPELYLLLKTAAALPQLEEKARSLKLVVEQRDKFIVVKNA